MRPVAPIPRALRGKHLAQSWTTVLDLVPLAGNELWLWGPTQDLGITNVPQEMSGNKQVGGGHAAPGTQTRKK